jgi:hypothetical protein
LNGNSLLGEIDFNSKQIMKENRNIEISSSHKEGFISHTCINGLTITVSEKGPSISGPLNSVQVFVCLEFMALITLIYWPGERKSY